MNLHRVVKGKRMEKERTVCASLVRHVLVTAIVFSIGAAYAQNNEVSIPPRPWVGEPSQALASKFQNWRLTFELGKPLNSPVNALCAGVGPAH